MHAAGSNVLDAWYDSIDAQRFMESLEALRKAKGIAGKQVKRADAALAKARTRDSMRAVAKLVEVVDGRLRIAADPPLIMPVEMVAPEGRAPDTDFALMQELMRSYQKTLHLARHPLREFSYVHMARKVVGVGSVGTRAWIVLLRGRDDERPPAAAGEAGRAVGARAIPAAERVRRARSTRRHGAAAHAGGERHLPRLAAGEGIRRRRA